MGHQPDKLHSQLDALQQLQQALQQLQQALQQALQHTMQHMIAMDVYNKLHAQALRATFQHLQHVLQLVRGPKPIHVFCSRHESNAACRAAAGSCE